MFPCHMDEFEKLARDHGSIIEKWDKATDEGIRPGVEWMRLIIRLPDDGTGALPISSSETRNLPLTSCCVFSPGLPKVRLG